MTGNFKRQSGVTLIIGMVILLLLTLISLAAIRITNLEESMAGNLRHENIAFQAAESALREAEAYIDSGAAPFNPLVLSGDFGRREATSCLDGLCSSPADDDDTLQSQNFPYVDVTEVEEEGDEEDADRSGTRTATTGIANIAREPEYIIELIRVDPSTDSSRLFATFRITTRGWGGDINSVVDLQSVYRLHTLSFAH